MIDSPKPEPPWCRQASTRSHWVSALLVCPPQAGTPGKIPRVATADWGVRAGMGHEWGGRSPRFGQRAHPPPGCPSRGGGPDELIGEGRPEPRLRAPAPREAGWSQRQQQGELSAPGTRPAPTRTRHHQEAEQTRVRQKPQPGRWAPGPNAHRPPNLARGPQARGRGAQRPRTTPTIAACRPGTPPPPRARRAQVAPQLGGPAAPPRRGLAGSAACGLRGAPGPPHARPRLTQKTKLKTKSRYLMHLVQPSTPMAARAAGGLRGAGRSGATGRGAWGPGGRPRTGTAAGGLGAAGDARDEWRGRLGRDSRGRRRRCALAFWPGARPSPLLKGRLGPAPRLLRPGPRSPPPARQPLPVARALRGLGAVSAPAPGAGCWARQRPELLAPSGPAGDAPEEKPAAGKPAEAPLPLSPGHLVLPEEAPWKR